MPYNSESAYEKILTERYAEIMKQFQENIRPVLIQNLPAIKKSADVAKSVYIEVNRKLNSSMMESIQKVFNAYNTVSRDKIMQIAKQASEYSAEASNSALLSYYDKDVLTKAVSALESYDSSETDSLPMPLSDAETESKESMTRSDWIALIGIMIAIIFDLIALIPSADNQKIISQNEILIEQNKQVIEQQKEQNDTLHEILDDCLVTLAEATRQFENLNDSVNGADDAVSDSQNIVHDCVQSKDTCPQDTNSNGQHQLGDD